MSDCISGFIAGAGLALIVMHGTSHAESATPDGPRSDDPRSDGPRLLDELTVDYEVGGAFVPKNTGRYGANGTRFDAGITNQSENLVVVQRLSLEGRRGKHRIIFLYAPLELATRLTTSSDLQFRDTLFAAGSVLDHRYLFDGYRASYLYALGSGLLGGDLTFEIGGSGQIRNANVSFTAVDGSAYDQQTDIGFVPALKARITYRGAFGVYGMLDADGSSTFGLVGDTEGYLYDVGLTLGIPILDELDLILRARGIGGGATVPEQAIDNRAHFLSLTTGVRIDFSKI